MAKRCYISGPITGIADYMERFANVEYDVAERYGFSVVNPARIIAEMPPDTSYEDQMRISIELLRLCDCIYLMGGWNNSRGATFEHEYAKIMGMEIIYGEE